MFGLRGLMLMLFTIFFSAFFFSFNARAQGAFITIINLSSSPNFSSEKSTETPGQDPSKDPREAQLESINQEIKLLEDQIESYKGWIQVALENNDSIGQQVHDLDPKAESFQDQLEYLNGRHNDNFDSVKTYEGYIDANRTRITELDDQRFKLKRDIEENPFHPEATPSIADPLQPLVSPPAQPGN